MQPACAQGVCLATADGCLRLCELQLRPPKGFDVPEAFNSKNWKGQIAFSGSARAAMDAFAAETLEKLRDAGGDELEAVVLNASSPQIAELAARIGCPTDAVLRYLIRVFEIKGGPERNHALLVGGNHAVLDSEERGERREEDLSSPPAAAQADREAADVDESLQRDSEAVPVEAPARQQWLGVATKVETKDRDRGVGLIVHRTREVRFQCHLCGHFYSWEKSIRLHYEKAHREPIPADEALYVLPWERKRRQEEKQQQAELSKFKRRRRTLFPLRETESAVSANHAADAVKATSFFINRLPTRGTVKAVEAPAKGFLLRATRDEEAVLASMSREDEITLIGAAIVAERLWQALQAAKEEPSAGPSSVEARDTRGGPLTDAWLSPGTPQSFPSEDHLIWQILGWLCRPPLPPASARLYVGFVLSRRALNARIYSSFRRLQPAALRHFVLEGRIPSALEIRVHCFPRDEAEGPRRSLVCRPLSSPRILMARNVLKAIVFTPLPFYRPALLLPALRELRPLELTGLWRAWQRRGWVTAFKLTSAAPTLREKTENEEPAEPAARLAPSARRPEIAAALESKCRRPFVLSRLRDYRSLSALLDATVSMAARTHALYAPDALDSPSCEGPMDDQEKQLVEERPREGSGNSPMASSPAVQDIQLSHVEREEGGADAGGGPVEDADLHLLQLLESEGVEQPEATSHSPLDMLQPSCVSEGIHPSEHLCAESQLLPETNAEALAVVGRVSLPVDSQLSGFEVLAALEGLARGQLWLSPFWGADGRLPDSPEAADDAALLNLLEEEEALDAQASGGHEEGAWRDVPEWLHALSLGPGEDAGELLAGRPQRKATEGGIETHITAHAAGVAEITAVTCAALGAPKGAPGGGALARPEQRKTTAGENLLADGSVRDTKEDAEEGEGGMQCAHVSSICKELGAAFALRREPANGRGRAEAHGTSKGFTLQPASHLPDGLFGAAGEYDAFDPSLLPPVFTDRTSSAAIALTDREVEGGGGPSSDAATVEGLALQPGLLCGFPQSLPTYATDHKQQWRLATKAAEAFAPRGCTCSAACKGASTIASNAAAASAAPSSAQEPPCSPVPPCRVFAKGGCSSSAAPLESERAQPRSEDACAKKSPIEILVLHLQEVRARQAAVEEAAGGLESLANPACRIPPVLLRIMHSVARVALHVQQHSLLPLLPTPPLSLAASLLHKQIEEEIQLQEASLAGDDPIPRRIGIHEETDVSDFSISASLILCSACLLAAVLKGQAEGVAVPHLLTEISQDKIHSTTQGTQQRSSLYDSSRLSFLCASAKLTRAFSNSGGGGGPVDEDWGAPSATAIGPSSPLEHIQWDSSRPVCGLLCQLFLVCTSMLCWLRLVVPVPAGSSWRLVSAAEAAQRFCLKEQRVVHDSVGARWALHGGRRDEDSHEKEEDNTTEEAGETHQHQLSPPAMMPRVIWSAWGPQAARREGHQRALSQQPPVSACPLSSPLVKEVKVLETDVEEHATQVLGLLSALLTWEEADSEGCASSEASSFSHCDNADAAGEARGRRGSPMQLARNLLPACAWLRLDGRLHASLVQLLCLRLWSLLVQRPGSTAQQLQGMLCLLDDCEVQFLLHALAEEGIVTAVVLPESYPLESAASDISPSAHEHERVPSADSAKVASAQARLDSREGFDEAAAPYAASPSKAFTLHAASRPSAADYALRSQTIYLPNPVEKVLPKFQPLLLPRLATCGCGCSALL